MRLCNLEIVFPNKNFLDFLVARGSLWHYLLCEGQRKNILHKCHQLCGEYMFCEQKNKNGIKNLNGLRQCSIEGFFSMSFYCRTPKADFSAPKRLTFEDFDDIII